MNRIVRIFIVLSGILFFVLVGVSVGVLNSVERTVRTPISTGERHRTIFHFIAYVPSMERDLFYIRAYNGMKEIAEKERSALQVFEYTPGEGYDVLARTLQLIADVSPDGVILALPQGNNYDSAIVPINKKGIPIVTLENDLPSSKRSAHVGTNAFELGRLAGQAVAARFPGKANIGLLISMNGGVNSPRDATFLQGFRQIFREFPALELTLVRSSSNEQTGGGEEFIRQILTSYPTINVAVFTNSRDAEGAAQTLIEFGRVGTPAILAFDDTPEIRKFIETGVILATISRNAEEAGREAMTSLLALAKNERTNAYRDPGATILTNVDLAQRKQP